MLLMNRMENQLVLLNPLARRVECFFDLDEVGILEDVGAHPHILDARLICFEGHPESYHIFCLAHDDSRVRVSVFASEIGGGFILPWVDAPGKPVLNDPHDWLCDGMLSGTVLFWFYRDFSRVVVLDTISLECHVEDVHETLPLNLYGSFVLGEDPNSPEDIPRMIHALHGEHTIGIKSMLNAARGTLNRVWSAEREIDLADEIHGMLMDIHIPAVLDNLVPGHHVLTAMRDGSVYFTTSEMGIPASAAWYASLRLDTGEVERLCLRSYDSTFVPYHMPWPHFLLGMLSMSSTHFI